MGFENAEDLQVLVVCPSTQEGKVVQRKKFLVSRVIEKFCEMQGIAASPSSSKWSWYRKLAGLTNMQHCELKDVYAFYTAAREADRQKFKNTIELVAFYTKNKSLIHAQADFEYDRLAGNKQQAPIRPCSGWELASEISRLTHLREYSDSGLRKWGRELTEEHQTDMLYSRNRLYDETEVAFYCLKALTSRNEEIERKRARADKMREAKERKRQERVQEQPKDLLDEILHAK